MQKRKGKNSRIIEIPRATYRLQFNADFQFKDAEKILDYLTDLGISDIYSSPIFKSGRGSTHGYDIIDFNRINPELGGEESFDRLIENAKHYKLGWIQDFVPNHMAYDCENQMLTDLFENGEASQFHDYFDIEWDHPYESIKGKMLTPFLGEFYGTCLENGEIKLIYTRNGLAIEYFDSGFPLKMETYTKVLTHNLHILEKKLHPNHPDFIKYLGILYVLKNLPQSKESFKERLDQNKFIKIELWGLYTGNNTIKQFLNDNIKSFNGQAGNPESFNLLDSLLAEQLFRLSFWKVANEEVNYRRFFTINRLISLNMQNENVFRYTHVLITDLIKKKKVTGLRIDHLDGLYDPTGYLERLRKCMGNVYIIIEKILHFHEDLPNIWPIQGTTGYDFLNYVNELFCERKNERKFNRIYSKFLGHRITYGDLVADKKGLLIEKHMMGDVDHLARLIAKISGKDRHGSDLTHSGLKNALVEILKLFPIYRTYVSENFFSQQDHFCLSETIKWAKEHNPDLSYELNFIEKFFLLKFTDYTGEEEKKEWIDFIMTFQQLTGPLMAKGFEDTVLYNYNRFISLNEVGGDPIIFGISEEDFHEMNKKRNRFWPLTLNAASTHDTKRGEDVRARITVLSEIPEQWEMNVKKWARTNKRQKRVTKGRAVPDKNDEYFLYQTLIGAMPFDEQDYETFIERISEYMVKAVREAKIHTAWIKPDIEYEERVTSFIRRILERTEQNRFWKEFVSFQKLVAHYGVFNSLSQTLLKITSPGVPDFYQGAELWDFNLVDPDNRRPVDFMKRKKYLREIKEREKENLPGLIRDLLLTKESGQIKLFLIYRSLKAKAEYPDLFIRGDYLPLKAEGKYKDHILSFSRNMEDISVIIIVPRFIVSLIKENELPLGEKFWEDTRISFPGDRDHWKDTFTEQVYKNREGIGLIGQIFKDFPAALLFNRLH